LMRGESWHLQAGSLSRDCSECQWLRGRSRWVREPGSADHTGHGLLREPKQRHRHPEDSGQKASTHLAKADATTMQQDDVDKSAGYRKTHSVHISHSLRVVAKNEPEDTSPRPCLTRLSEGGKRRRPLDSLKNLRVRSLSSVRYFGNPSSFNVSVRKRRLPLAGGRSPVTVRNVKRQEKAKQDQQQHIRTERPSSQ